jgi:catechol 2,3-dioxygenase-like lactoylglutathione lyase family enzyme
MPFAHVGGIDHAVIMVRDLAAAAAQWADLGFTVSTRGVHSAHVGAANHTVVLQNDYIELLGVLRETEANAPSRAFLARRGDGIERLALATADAAAAADELRHAGIAATGPFAFGRPVPLPGGGEVEALFRIARWPRDVAPASVRLFVCEHLTPGAVWRPELQRHANTARRLKEIGIVTSDPSADAARMAAATSGSAAVGEEGKVVVALPDGPAIAFQTADLLCRRYPGLDESGLPSAGAVALVLEAGDLAAARSVLGARSREGVAGPYVLPPHATGTLVAFEAA